MPEESCEYLSEIEKEILRSSVPIQLNETDEISVFGERGLWANKLEVLNWKSDIPLERYQLNEDQNPEIIIKKLKDSIEYIHEIAIRYLKPPSPPGAGEIVITQEPNKIAPPAPPLIIRQQPARPCTPEPLIIREAPPPLPDNNRKVITISGKLLPPPPRKVIIERLSKIPPKPQAVIIERWLPYTPTKRKIIYKGAPPDPVICKPKNLIIQWEAPEVCIKKQVKYLGVVKADPEEYTRKYGSTLKRFDELPQEVLDIKYPDDLLEEMKNSSMLEGDVEALKLVDLDKEGLSIYRDYLTQIGIITSQSRSTLSNKSRKSSRQATPEVVESSTSFLKPTGSTHCQESVSSAVSFFKPTGSVSIPCQETLSSATSRATSVQKSRQSSVDSISLHSTNVPETKSQFNSNSTFNEWSGSYEGSDEFLRSIFNFMDYDEDGQVKLEEVKRTLNVLNEKFKRNYIELSAVVFLNTFDRNKDGYIDFQEFKESIREILSLK